MSAPTYAFMASAPRGCGDLLARELESFGATEIRDRPLGVEFRGDLAVAYRACLGSRVASRVYLELARFEAPDADAFYRAARTIDWTRHLAPGATLACDFTGRHPTITHTNFGALKLKDAIVDALRDARGERPDVDPVRPSVRVHAHAHGLRFTVSLDLSGEGLHRRGYRTQAGEAPLRENVAAAILLRAGWDRLAAEGAEFLDPMCGSGTFPIEAALIAHDVASGLRRDYFGFLGWAQHDPAAWQMVRDAALERAAQGRSRSCVIRGSDRDPRMVALARDNATRAGVADLVAFETGDVGTVVPRQEEPGLLCVNPPYGVRLEDREGARRAMREIGSALHERFPGWHGAVLAGQADLGHDLGVRAHRTHVVWNGALECLLLRVAPHAASLERGPRTARVDPDLAASPGARMFANRVQKNAKQLRRWTQREQVTCYRLYDADMPEYSFAVDAYASAESDERWLYVQEYAAPASIDPEAVRRRRGEALSALPEATGVPADHIHVRTRRRVARGDQYSRVGDHAGFHVVAEGGLKFRVNFTDYLDTGLFLDHRITRARLRDAARGRRFLNLFAYTASATVYAAAGGARTTTSVDLSNTYLDWASRNLALNGFEGREHALVRADCREWLEAQSQRGPAYDLVFLDPPTFSNSARMEGVLDTQRDHAALVDACMRLLAPDGLLVFSTNAQKFRLDETLAERYAVEDISRATLPPDFERNPRIHRCFEIRGRRGG